MNQRTTEQLEAMHRDHDEFHRVDPMQFAEVSDDQVSLHSVENDPAPNLAELFRKALQ